MLALNSSRIFSPSSNWFFLLVLIYFLLISGLPVEAQAPTRIDKLVKKNATAKEKTGKSIFDLMQANPWSKITGFRSAKFGMNEKSVYRAIAKDFDLPKRKVKKVIHSSEKTTTLEITVPDLFRTGGTAKVAYVLGYKSKKLIMVHIYWGRGAAEKVDGENVVRLANTLRTHFLKKRYIKDKLVVNGKVSDTQTVVFRGKDQKNRMVTLVLNAPGKQGEETLEDAVKKISLVLSYIVDPDNPDVLSVEVKEGEF